MHDRARLWRGIGMIGHATAGQMFARLVDRNFRIEGPFLFAGGRVERDDMIVRSADIEHVADLDRGVFIGGLARIGRQFFVAGMKEPGDFQLVRIGGRNIGQCRITPSITVCAIGGPVIAGNRFGRGNARGRARQFARHQKRIV